MRAALVETHSTIPRLLSQERSITHELSLAEARGESTDALRKQLEDVIQQRQSAVRRRAACIETLAELEGATGRESRCGASTAGARHRLSWRNFSGAIPTLCPVCRRCGPRANSWRKR